MDFLSGFPTSYLGNKNILVFTDYHTKWVEAFPTADQLAVTVAQLFVNNIICRHGCPRMLLSDRGTNFVSELLKEVTDLMGTTRKFTTAYHPQSDGLTERFNRTLITMLRSFVDYAQRDWDALLPSLLFSYNVSAHESTGDSPFFLLHGLRLHYCLILSFAFQKLHMLTILAMPHNYAAHFVSPGNWLEKIFLLLKTNKNETTIAKLPQAQSELDTGCTYITPQHPAGNQPN